MLSRLRRASRTTHFARSRRSGIARMTSSTNSRRAMRARFFTRPSTSPATSSRSSRKPTTARPSMCSRSRIAASLRPMGPAPTIRTFRAGPRSRRRVAACPCRPNHSNPERGAATAPSHAMDCKVFAGTGRARPRKPSGLNAAGKDMLGRLQFVSFNGDRHRSLNAFHRNDQGLLGALRQDAFQSVEASASNSDTLPYSQKCVQGARQLLRQQTAQVVNLPGRNRTRISVRPAQIP